jgi:hypothetical protein
METHFAGEIAPTSRESLSRKSAEQLSTQREGEMTGDSTISKRTRLERFTCPPA